MIGRLLRLPYTVNFRGGRNAQNNTKGSTARRLHGGGAGLIGIAPASPASSRASAPSQDYLNSTTMFGGSGSDQCGKAVSVRVGNWVCPEADPATATKSSTATATSADSTETTAASTSWCRVNVGCWIRRSDFEAVFSSGGATWGYGPTTLGTENHYIHIWLQGPTTWSDDVEYTNTRTTDQVIIEGNLLNAAPGSGGPIRFREAEPLQPGDRDRRALVQVESERLQVIRQHNVGPQPGPRVLLETLWLLWLLDLRQKHQFAPDGRMPHHLVDYGITEDAEPDQPPPAGTSIFIGPVFQKSGPLFPDGDPTKIEYWHAFLGDGQRALEEFGGTREEVIEWARVTSADVKMIYDEERVDYVPL